MGLFWVFKTKWFYFPVISFNAFCPENFYGSEIQHGIFGGLNFGVGIFWRFCLNPKGFFWVLIFAPIRSSLSLGQLKFGVTPPPFPSPGSRSGSISFISCMNFYGSSWTKHGPKEHENIICDPPYDFRDKGDNMLTPQFHFKQKKLTFTCLQSTLEHTLMRLCFCLT